MDGEHHAETGGRREAMLIDFDWAGQARQVRYSVTRSDGSGYPRVPGGSFARGNGRRFYERWKRRLLDT